MQLMKQVISSFGSWPTQRSAIVPLPLHFTTFASEMIGPKAQRRILRRVGRQKRDRITVSLLSISSGGSLETS